MPFGMRAFFRPILGGYMIKMHHFNEAYQYFQQQKISFRVLQDQAFVMMGVCDSPHLSIANPIEITKCDIDWLLQQEETSQSYDALLGGNIYICETEHDLLEIQRCNFEWAETHDGQWPNVTDLPMSWDVCEYLDEPTDEPQWVIFMLCWTNAGGSIYYVPKHLWGKARMTEHITEINS